MDRCSRVPVVAVLLCAVLVCTSAQAQPYWAPGNLPITALQLFQIYPDPDHDALYFCGGFSGDGTNSLNSNGVMRWQNNDWDTLGDFANFVRSVVVYHDTLIATGVFQAVSGDSIAYIAYYDGSAWQPYGELDDSCRKLRVLNDELYVAGGFTYADGHLCNGIAKRVGGHWENVGELTDEFNSAIVVDMVIYQGDLIITGSINLNSTQRDILRYDGSTWSAVGPYGLLGGFSVGKCLAVYKDELYVGGLFLLGAGNAGQAIMRWNGTEWNSLGVGPQHDNGSYQYNYQVESLTVHDSLLFVGGGFHYAGNVPASLIATWDGGRWCGLGGEHSDQVISSAFFHDTLYVSCGLEADGNPVNRLAKFVGPSYEDTCSVSMGMAVAEEPERSAVVFWDDGDLCIRLPDNRQHQVHLLDAMGRTVAEFNVVNGLSSPWRFPLDPGANGLYFVSIQGGMAARFVCPAR